MHFQKKKKKKFQKNYLTMKMNLCFLIHVLPLLLGSVWCAKIPSPWVDYIDKLASSEATRSVISTYTGYSTGATGQIFCDPGVCDPGVCMTKLTLRL